MTKSIYDIAFWQNTVSLHQGPLIRELGRMGLNVLVVTQNGTSQARRSMGWGEADFGAADVVVAPSPSSLQDIVRTTGSQTAHVFSGMDAYPMVSTARRLVQGQPHGQIFISTESFDTRGPSGLARLGRYLWKSRRLRGVNTVLAIGRQAYEQFDRLLPAGMRVVKFGYFVDSQAQSIDASTPVSGPVHVVFVGELIELKRPGLLLESLLAEPHQEWRLTVIGDGPLREGLSNQASLFPDADVSFLGTVPNDAVARTLLTADVLVLPSLYDGWGAVVSEALAVGTPVLVSSAAGSSDLISTPLAGRVFDARSEANFRLELSASLNAGRVSPTSRLALSVWAKANTSPAAAASYLARLLRDPQARAVPPWQGTRIDQKDNS
jgi:glycosyltransferase involved in cell wall biosynthesis